MPLSKVSIMPYLTLLTALFLLPVNHVRARPKPGDVYREYFFRGKGDEPDPRASWTVVAVHGWKVWQWDQPFHGDVDKAHAVSAEIELQKVHFMKFKGLQFKFNSGPWRDIPHPDLPFNGNEYLTPQAYFATIEIPLSEIDEQQNKFNIRGDISTFEPYEGLTEYDTTSYLWMEHFPTIMLRVYYDPAAKPHATGTITSPASGSTISGPEIDLAADVTPGPSPVADVDYVGYYYDVSHCGDEIYTRWHYYYDFQDRAGHLGTATVAPEYNATWSTHWVPDQPGPLQIAALITDTDTLTTMTEPVDNITLERSGWSVELCPPSNQPQRWVVSTDAHGCEFNIAGDVTQLKDARIVMTNFAGAESRNFTINGSPIAPPLYFANGWKAYRACEEIESTGLFTRGLNHFKNVHYEHAALSQIMWPGPMLLLRYGNAPKLPDTTLEPVITSTPRIMPLGNSITAGGNDSTTYRFYLDGLLTNAGHDFDFTGTRTGPQSLDVHEWDGDHQSVPGYEIDWMMHMLRDALPQTRPDIVLIHLGTNDLMRESGTHESVAAQTLTDLQTMIDYLQTSNPHVICFVAKVIPTKDPDVNAGLEILNQSIDQLAETSANSPYGSVFVVDMWSAVDTGTLRDMWHPDETGASAMADVWFEALDPVLGDFSRPTSAQQNTAGDEPRLGDMHISYTGNTIICKAPADFTLNVYSLTGQLIRSLKGKKGVLRTIGPIAEGCYIADVMYEADGLSGTGGSTQLLMP